jgi:hypothetical protein
MSVKVVRGSQHGKRVIQGRVGDGVAREKKSRGVGMMHIMHGQHSSNRSRIAEEAVVILRRISAEEEERRRGGGGGGERVDEECVVEAGWKG